MRFKLIIFIFLVSGCSMTSKLNEKINLSQKDCLLNSPFIHVVNGMDKELKIQIKYRENYNSDIDSLIKTYPNDTIILKENYDFICLGCPADYVQVFVEKIVVTYTKQFNDKKYQRSIEKLSQNFIDSKGYSHNDILELKQELVKNKFWNKHPDKYGTDKCLDGGHTFYTIIYPDGRIESMYMRCWLNKDSRDSIIKNNNP